MYTINDTTARAQLAETMDRVNEDCIPLLVTRQKGEPVMMMSLAQYNALEETAYLLRSPANAERLIKSHWHTSVHSESAAIPLLNSHPHL